METRTKLWIVWTLMIALSSVGTLACDDDESATQDMSGSDTTTADAMMGDTSTDTDSTTSPDAIGGDASEDATADTSIGPDGAINDISGDGVQGPVNAVSRMIAVRGTATGVAGLVPDIDGDGVEDDALCFNDLELVELATGAVVGTASDCLSEITPVNDGLSLIGTTTFTFDDGTLVTRGTTSVQPTTGGSLDVTNITGAIPQANENSVLSGTGVYLDASGPARLSGAVFMNPLANGDLEMTFDCFFLLTLDRGMGVVPENPTSRLVALRGTAVGVPDTVADIDGDGMDDDAACFNNLDIVDLATGDVVGTASDCLSNVTPVGDGLSLIGTSFFDFAEGTLTTRGMTTVQPTTAGSPDVTHITGAIPQAGDNSVIDGTGDYAGASGPARLSGAVAMNPLANGDLEITFDCLFVLSVN